MNAKGRAVLGVVVLLLVVGAIGWVFVRAEEDPREGNGGQPTASTSPTADTPQAPEPDPEPDRGPATRGPHDEPAVEVPTEGSWRRTATAYGRDFVNVAGGRRAWLQRLRRSAAPALLQGLEQTRLSRVPRTRLRRVVFIEDDRSDTAVRVSALLRYRSGLRVQVHLEPVRGRWRVTSALPLGAHWKHRGR